MTSITTPRATERQRKSVMLTPYQKDHVRQVVEKHVIMLRAAKALGVERGVLERILLRGSCSEESFRKLFPNDPLPEA